MEETKENSIGEKPATVLKTWEKPKLVVLDVTPSTQGKPASFISEFNATYGLS